jgi:hypothetical protein
VEAVFIPTMETEISLQDKQMATITTKKCGSVKRKRQHIHVREQKLSLSFN